MVLCWCLKISKNYYIISRRIETWWNDLLHLLRLISSIDEPHVEHKSVHLWRKTDHRVCGLKRISANYHKKHDVTKKTPSESGPNVNPEQSCIPRDHCDQRTLTLAAYFIDVSKLRGTDTHDRQVELV